MNVDHSYDCAECGMRVPGGWFYHPHLHCTIWKAYHQDPAKVLADYGYQRVPAEVQP